MTADRNGGKRCLALCRTLTVLVIEDEPSVNAALCAMLQTHKESTIVPVPVGTIREAMQMLQTLIPDCILLDLILPNGEGDLEVKKFKTLFPQIPVVVITGKPRPGLENEVINMGAKAFVTKPTRADELVNAVMRGMAQHEVDRVGGPVSLAKQALNSAQEHVKEAKRVLESPALSCSGHRLQEGLEHG